MSDVAGVVLRALQEVCADKVVEFTCQPSHLGDAVVQRGRRGTVGTPEMRRRQGKEPPKDSGTRDQPPRGLVSQRTATRSLRD